MNKVVLNNNIHLQEGNSVLVDNEECGFLIFSLPARECCPYATDLCKKICYGRNAQELFKRVYECRKRNYEESLKESFTQDMIKIINYNLNRKKYKDKIILFRIHETGDFYSQEYTDKWFNIADYYKNNSKIFFQCYTKSLPFIKDNIANGNIKMMFSVMDDTKCEDIELAKSLGMNTFKAVPNNVFINTPREQQCDGDCSKCKSCYLDNKDMVVEYHGNRIPRQRSTARKEYDKQLYWSWKYKN